LKCNVKIEEVQTYNYRKKRDKRWSTKQYT